MGGQFGGISPGIVRGYRGPPQYPRNTAKRSRSDRPRVFMRANWVERYLNSVDVIPQRRPRIIATSTALPTSALRPSQVRCRGPFYGHVYKGKNLCCRRDSGNRWKRGEG